MVKVGDTYCKGAKTNVYGITCTDEAFTRMCSKKLNNLKI